MKIRYRIEAVVDDGRPAGWEVNTLTDTGRILYGYWFPTGADALHAFASGIPGPRAQWWRPAHGATP